MQLLQTTRRSDRRIIYLLCLAAIVLAAILAGRLINPPAANLADPGSGRARSFAPPTTAETVARLRDQLSAQPEATDLYAQLGLALMQQVRETADPTLYGQAEAALGEALARDPEQLDALVGQGMLALARHDFAAALEWGGRALAVMPYRPDAHAVIVDALVELGRYPEAMEAAQRLVNLRPDVASYSRVSYVRELHGNTAGAVAAMRSAVDAAPPGSEALAWTQVQLGNLYFQQGNLPEAERAYREALAGRPGYAYAEGGLARVMAASGKADEAVAALESVTARLPLPEFVILLGELYESSGRPEQAQSRFDLVRAIQHLNADAGMNVDLEMALFEANRGDTAEALRMAAAAYRQRPTVYAEDILAWAHYKNGDLAEASRLSERALRLGTQDALLFYHAGMIAAARGETAAARDQLEHALALNPHFGVLDAPRALETLENLETE